jgi:DNA-directed RNA polymerase specialized sigma24 family protein
MSPQAGWILQEEIVPRLRSAIPRSVNYVGSEDTEELVQDATCMAAKLMHHVEQQGKTVTPGNIAYYTILHMKSGRRSCGVSTTDALGVGTQLNGRASVNSLDEPAEAEELGELFTLNDVFSTDTEDPGQIAARKMDWESFCAGLTAREQAVIEHLLAGRNLGEVAVKFNVCLSTIQTCKNRLAVRILDYMGVDILIEVLRLPGWKNSLNASRERLACRFERRNC